MPSVDGRRTDTRERLIAAALRLFAQQGYATTSVAEIEGAVGLRPGGGGLYRHFKSKDELLLAAAQAYTERVRSVRRRLAEEREASHDTATGARARASSASRAASSVAAALRHLVEVLGEFLSGEQAMVRLNANASDIPRDVRRAIGEAWDEGYGMVADIFVHQGVPVDEAEVLAVSALGALNHYVTFVGSWGIEPNGVSLDRFLDGWVRQWSAAVDAAVTLVGAP